MRASTATLSVSMAVPMAVLMIVALTACSRERQDWRSAEAADTIEGYGHFIEQHPDSERAAQARTRIAQLGEERDWKIATGNDTAAGYRHFLAQHPDGKWAQEARIRVENFALSALPAQPSRPEPAPKSAPEPAVPPPAAHAPAPRKTATPAEAPSVSGSQSMSFGIQLGAFSTAVKAQAEWQRLSSRFGRQLGGLTPRVVAASSGGGRIFRLQAALPDEASARRMCADLTRQAQSCVVVLP